jgi:prophage tail gpP-like protein
MTTFNPLEQAQIQAGGIVVEDFETVWVQLRDGEAWDEFRFTMAERMPPSEWALLQLQPGMDCKITLGGKRAITGTIISRQVAYDATSHATQLYGKTGTVWAAKSSAKTKTGTFDNKTFMQIVDEVLHGGYIKYDVHVTQEGREFKEPLKQIQIQQGESIWDFLERVARPIGAIMSSNQDGEIVVIWPRTMTNAGPLIEGENILKCNFVVSEDTTHAEYLVTAQSDAKSSGNTGRSAQEIISDPVKGIAPKPSLLVTMAEGPLQNKQQATERANNEMRWGDGARVQAQITVQGWINPATTDLWLPGQVVSLYSPMVPANGMALGIKSATFTQDNRSGTLTVLELVQPEYLNGGGTGGKGWSPGDPAIDHAVPPFLESKILPQPFPE